MTGIIKAVGLTLPLFLCSPFEWRWGSADRAETSATVIVQSVDIATAAEAVRRVGGKVTHELGIIRSVGAPLKPSQQHQLVDGVETSTPPKRARVLGLAVRRL